MRNRVRVLVLIGLIQAFTWCQAALADTPATEEVTEDQVYAEAELLFREVERIRIYTGTLPPRSWKFRLENAQPRHVFFQSQIAFRRSNLLAQQMTGVSLVAAPLAPEKDPTLAEVLAIIAATRGHLDAVEETLGLTGPLPDAQKVRSRDVSGALMQIVRANELLNEVTGFRADWADVWDRLLLCITYLGGALAEDSRYPALEEYVPGKMPGAVATLLMESRVNLAPLFESVGVAAVRSTIIKRAEGGVPAATVHDLTVTLVNDYAEVTYRMGAENVDRPDFKRPARVFPSHAFQLATIIRKQSETLAEMHKKGSGKR